MGLFRINDTFVLFSPVFSETDSDVRMYAQERRTE
jgi:hypothetical protein